MWYINGMNPEQDLNTATREALLTIIEEQQTTIAQLQQQVAALETRVSGRRSFPGMPGNKATAKAQRSAKKGKRKPRPHGFARKRMVPTQQVEHAVAVCPECKTQLSGGWVQRRREVIELPMVPVQVTEHLIMARVCPICEKRRVPQEALEGVVSGRQRLGVNLVSQIVTLREEGRLPLRAIKWYLKTIHQLDLSLGSVTQAVHRVAQLGQGAVAEILERVRGSPVVHADETGWREEGQNGYVWTFSTPTEEYFLRRGRDKGVVDEVLGDSFSGVLTCDFYAAYNHYPGPKQRCWAHLLRHIHELKNLYPEDAGLARWSQRVRKLFREAKAFASADPKARRRVQLRLERRLLTCCRPFLDDPLAVQGKLCRRITKFIKELFVFVAYPEVPSDNNPAERSLRHLVTSRKISGGTRSPQGTTAR